MRYRDLVEVARYGRGVWNDAWKAKNLSGEELDEHLCNTEDRLRVSSHMKVPTEVISALSKVYFLSGRVSGVASHMVGVFVSQNDIAWDTEQNT